MRRYWLNLDTGKPGSRRDQRRGSPDMQPLRRIRRNGSRSRRSKPEGRSRKRDRSTLPDLFLKVEIINQLKITTMTKAQMKQVIDKEIRAMRSRITDIVKNRIADQILDDLSDETGELMGKLTVDFADDKRITYYAYSKIYDALLEELIKYLKNPR